MLEVRDAARAARHLVAGAPYCVSVHSPALAGDQHIRALLAAEAHLPVSVLSHHGGGPARAELLVDGTDSLEVSVRVELRGPCSLLRW